MKLSLSLIALMSLIAGSSRAEAGLSLFTENQERKVLEAVQAACNNTWCEGEFGYNFKKFHCEKNSCSLELDIIFYGKHDADGHPDASSAERNPVICDYAPVKRLSDVLNARKDYVSANYFQSLAKCIDMHASNIGDSILWDPKSYREPDMPLPVEVQNTPPAVEVPDSANALIPALKQ